MEKSWNQLAERCNLFYTAPDGLYIELLKEAEEILAERCSLLKEKFTYFPNSNEKQNAYRLPMNYKQMLGVWVNGNLIEHKDKTEWSFNKGTTTSSISDQLPVMTVNKGVPNYYCVINDMLTLDKIPSADVTIDIYYTASIDPQGYRSVLLQAPYNNQVRINTSLTNELIGKNAYYYTDSYSINAIAMTGIGGDGSEYQSSSQKTTALENEGYWRVFNSTGTWVESVDSLNDKVFNGWVNNWRDVAPIIEGDYHLSLCDYAIYVASAKKNPELSMTRLQMWEKTIFDTVNDNVDRDLQFSIKEEI